VWKLFGVRNFNFDLGREPALLGNRIVPIITGGGFRVAISYTIEFAMFRSLL